MRMSARCLITLIFLFPSFAFASDWLSNDYRISASSSTNGTALQVTGYVEDGPACRSLQVKVGVRDSTGAVVSLVAFVQDVGRASKILETNFARVRRNSHGWEVVSVQATCVNN